MKGESILYCDQQVHNYFAISHSATCFDTIVSFSRSLYVYCTLTEVFLNLTEAFLTLTEVFPCFFLSCKANERVKLAKTGHGPHSSTLVVI